jgi:hypothetical protein
MDRIRVPIEIEYVQRHLLRVSSGKVASGKFRESPESWEIGK